MTASLIHINQRYKSSTRIDSTSVDYTAFIDSYILHGTAVNVLDTISRDFSGSAQRAYTLTGPYGSGKSTIALYLSSLLSTTKKERSLAQSKLLTQGDITNFSERFSVKKGWKVVKHVCGLEAPANAILLSLYNALNIEYDVHAVKTFTDEECLTAIKEALSTKSTFDGVLLLLDEMGKALDFQSRANKDLHLFQALADIVQQAKTPTVLIGFLHQAFSDYAKNKDASTQKEWAKVQGRYRDIGFNPSIDESLVLVGDSITVNKSLTSQLENEHRSLVSTVLSSFPSQERNSNSLFNTLPLDPLVSLLLGPISRRRFSQNERSLFGFLASFEKLGFREFLTNNYQKSPGICKLYQPEQLWDYLHYNLHHLIVSSSDSKAWLEACDAINRAEIKGDDLHVSLTKVIALLTIFGFHHHLHASKKLLLDYYVARGFKLTAVSQVIDELEQWTVVIFRQKHNALFVFQGSDIDINNLVLEKIESLSEGVDWTKACDLQQPILATAHYHKTGTMRWANLLLINKIDDTLLEALKAVPLTGQAFLTFLLPASKNIEQALYKIHSELPYSTVASYSNLSSLKSCAIELIALEQILKYEDKITHDLIAKNELESRIILANQNVNQTLDISFRGATWAYSNDIYEKQPLTVITSAIADKVFDKSPEVQNELINRSKPSGSANTAIRKLLYAMLDNANEEDLGFESDSFPPEKGIYLSCLKSKGWHNKTSEGFMFPSKWGKETIEANPKMHELWQDGINFIKSSEEMVTLDDLYNHWMKPPFGITTGLCRIYGLALLKSLEGQVAFYDFDSTKQFIFIPELDEELVNKIYKHPKEAGVRYFEISSIQTHLLDTLAKATVGTIKSDDAILSIAKHIVKIIHKLPAWVKKTSGESFSQEKSASGLTKEARALRNKVIAANDPYKLILDDLPKIFELNEQDTDLDNKLAARLKTAIEDLSAQHDMLLSGFKHIITTNLSANFDDMLKARCEFVASIAQRPNVKELATRLAKYINDGKFEPIINLAAAVPERNWTDKHLRNALDELQNLCMQFRRIESFGHVSKYNKSNGSLSQPLSFVTTDNKGKQKEFSGYITNNLSSDKEVTAATKQVYTSLKGLAKDKQLAALTNLLADLMEEVSHD